MNVVASVHPYVSTGLFLINVKQRLLTIALNSILMNLCLPYIKVGKWSPCTYFGTWRRGCYLHLGLVNFYIYFCRCLSLLFLFSVTSLLINCMQFSIWAFSCFILYNTVSKGLESLFDVFVQFFDNQFSLVAIMTSSYIDSYMALYGSVCAVFCSMSKQLFRAWSVWPGNQTMCMLWILDGKLLPGKLWWTAEQLR